MPERLDLPIDSMAPVYFQNLVTVSVRSYNTAVQAVNPKKVYCADHARVQAFSRATSENKSFVLENMVYIALRRSGDHIHYYKYYKTSRGDEIDFAVGPDADMQLVQVCWELSTENRTRERELKPLLDGMEELGLQESWIITAYEEEEFKNKQTDRVIHVVPAYSWLLQR